MDLTNQMQGFELRELTTKHGTLTSHLFPIRFADPLTKVRMTILRASEPFNQLIQAMFFGGHLSQGSQALPTSACWERNTIKARKTSGDRATTTKIGLISSSKHGCVHFLSSLHSTDLKDSLRGHQQKCLFHQQSFTMYQKQTGHLDNLESQS